LSRAKRLPEVLTEEEWERLLKAPNSRTPTGLRNLCMMLLMLNTGLRVAEVLNLKVREVNWNTGKLLVKEGKGKKDRILWLGEEDLKMLAKWREKRWVQTENLFTTLKGSRLNDRYIRAMVKREAEAAGIEKDVHPHMLRHTFATDIYRDTKNIRLTQRVLGHSNLATTMIYTHIVDDEVEDAMRFFRRKDGVVLNKAS
jgi:site-specific recombinase XerD